MYDQHKAERVIKFIERITTHVKGELARQPFKLEPFQKEGRIYETFASNGAKVLKAHPAAQQSADAWRRIRMMLIEFGLTPASRSKLERPEGRTLDIDDIIEM